ncbi:ORF420 [White spot syndrome virus]|uniref:ORF420 n=1 Tax=White spot syndrome virus TaxID=342409 RepID=A0A2D3I4W2_9VIRU|nr:ORF420 [White spot syndrome virus]
MCTLKTYKMTTSTEISKNLSDVLSIKATGDWCSNIKTVFSPFTEGKGNLPNSLPFTRSPNTTCGSREAANATEHFITVFAKDKYKRERVKRTIGFTLDNTKELTPNRYLVADVYSWQEEKMVFEGFCVPPGKSGTFVRYSNEDKSFLLADTGRYMKKKYDDPENKTSSGGDDDDDDDDDDDNNNVDVYEENDPRNVFEVEKDEKYACTFSILVYRAMKKSPPVCRGLLVETDGPSSHPKRAPSAFNPFGGSSMLNGYGAGADALEEEDEVDGVPERERITNFALKRGPATGQNFVSVKLEHDGSKADLYNVTCFSKQRGV